jgi:aminopeptidase
MTMAAINADAYAKLLCDWCLDVRPSQQVLIVTTTLAEEPVLALHREILRRGAWPILRVTPPQLSEEFYTHATDAQLDGFAPLELAEVEQADAWLRIDAPGNTRALASVDPVRVARAGRARNPIQEARLSGTRWCGTIWPTPALAQQAGMGEGEYARFIGRALLLDQADPVHAWRELSDRQQRVVERLARAEEIRIEADGTDLTLSVGGRTWINSDGKRNMPSGEVFTGPVEDSANGTVRFTVPSSFRGAEVRNATVRFVDGRVVDAQAEIGQAQLDAALATDPGARLLGEIGIGTNAGIDRATGSTLLDEKIAGTVHLALGRSYPETGGTNVSALHWDLICDLRSGGRLLADGEPLQLF